jgi:hypothetical protein
MAGFAALLLLARQSHAQIALCEGCLASGRSDCLAVTDRTIRRSRLFRAEQFRMIF